MRLWYDNGMRLPWRRSRGPSAPVEVRLRVQSVETRFPAGSGDPSPVFGLRSGETRRIVIDGVAFDVTREEDDPV